jgi:GT2 family glycosyltransferase
MPPQVDIIVPNYNYGHFLDACLASIVQQDVAIRVLVLDDGSLVKRSLNSTITLPPHVTLETRAYRFNRGHIFTYNEGIRLVHAPYYMLLSPDDQLLPGGLKSLLQALESYKDAAFSFSPALAGSDPYSASTTIGMIGMEPFLQDRPVLVPGPDFHRHLSSLWFNPVPTPATLIRTSVQRRAGGYRYNHPSAGDLEMWLRLSRYGPVVYVPWPTAFYRLHGSNMQTSYLKARYREPVHLAKVHLESDIPAGAHTIASTLVQLAFSPPSQLPQIQGNGSRLTVDRFFSLRRNKHKPEEWQHQHLLLATGRYPMLQHGLEGISLSLRRLLSHTGWAGWKIFLKRVIRKLTFLALRQ